MSIHLMIWLVLLAFGASSSSAVGALPENDEIVVTNAAVDGWRSAFVVQSEGSANAQQQHIVTVLLITDRTVPRQELVVIPHLVLGRCELTAPNGRALHPGGSLEVGKEAPLEIPSASLANPGKWELVGKGGGTRLHGLVEVTPDRPARIVSFNLEDCFGTLESGDYSLTIQANVYDATGGRTNLILTSLPPGKVALTINNPAPTAIHSFHLWPLALICVLVLVFAAKREGVRSQNAA